MNGSKLLSKKLHHSGTWRIDTGRIFPKIFRRQDSTRDVMIWIEAESDEDHCPRNGISKWKNRRRGRLGEEGGDNMAPSIVSNVEAIRGLKRRVRSMVRGTNERKRKRTSGEKGRGLSGEEERSAP